MPVEIEFVGFFAPILLPVLVASVVTFAILVLARYRVYRFAWHPSLFRVALFMTLFCGAALLVQP
jgi:hypothetical protein